MIQDLASAFCLGQLGILMAVLARDYWYALAARFFFVLCISLITYLVHPVLVGQLGQYPLAWLMDYWPTTVPAVFWLVCQTAFNDQFRLSPTNLALPVVSALFPLLAVTYQHFVAPLQFIATRILFDLPQTIEFVLIFHALWTVAKHRRTDLVESRRQLSIRLLFSSGLFILWVVTMQQLFDRQLAFMHGSHVVLLTGFLMWINLMLVRGQPGLLFGAQSPDPESIEPAMVEVPEPNPLVVKVTAVMTEDRVYEQEGLTIGQLAQTLALPEHRLRHVINVEMGFRNFNDFLNRYRIKAAKTRLLMPDQVPILTVALEVGFRSLSSFNRAFKESTGVTPSQFRQSGGVGN